MGKDFFFEIDGYSVDEKTGEHFPAGVKCSIEQGETMTEEEAALMIAERFGIPADKIRIISEEDYIRDYQDDDQDSDWEED